MAYEWEREEWRCAVEAAEDAGELDTYYWDRPTKADLFDDYYDDQDEWEACGRPLEGEDDER
jgi:hypothetical protein